LHLFENGRTHVRLRGVFSNGNNLPAHDGRRRVAAPHVDRKQLAGGLQPHQHRFGRHDQGAYANRESVAAVIEAYLEYGIDAIMGLMTQTPILVDAAKLA
jgi:hypothetical protein